MKARGLLENGSLGPDHLAVLFKAFDEAWEVVKTDHAATPLSTEAGRLRLANAVLVAYRHGATDPDALKAAALQSMRDAWR